ncbi:MAG: hypothetical protein AAFO84_01090, partial [Cyanobacteria bacterium J06598_1]
MTAPQHDDSTAPQQGNSHYTQRQKLQRCWFITLGLLGGFGFVTSQMSFALAEPDGYSSEQSANAEALDLGNYAASNYGASNYGANTASEAYTANTYVEDTYAAPYVDQSYTIETAEFAPAPPTFAPAPPTFEVATASAPMPAPAAFIEAPIGAPETVADAAPSEGVSYSAKDLGSPSISTADAAPSAVVPTVTSAAPPTFTRPSKPSAKVIASASYPLAGAIEAGT